MLRVLALGWRSLGVHRRAGLKPVRTYVRRSIRPPWRGRCTSREVGARRRPAPGAGTIGPPLPPPGEARALGQDVREGWSAGRRRQCRSLPSQAALSWKRDLPNQNRVRIAPNHHTLLCGRPPGRSGGRTLRPVTVTVGPPPAGPRPRLGLRAEHYLRNS